MKKRICILVPDISTTAGAERAAINLANCLSVYYDIFLVSILKKEKSCSYMINSDVKTCYLTNSNRIRYQVISGLFKLRSFFKNNKIDISISVLPYCSVISAVASIGTNVKLITCEHSNLANLFEHKFQNKFYRWVGARFANKVITLTETDKLSYIDMYKLDKNKVDYIYNFIDEKLILNNNKYNKESKIILSVGRLNKVKGYDMLIRVARGVFAKYPEWKWHIYGGGDTEYIEKIKNKIIEFDLENRVLLMGESKEIYNVYSEAAIFVLTSYFEGFSMVLLEAKVNKLPAVSFDCPTGPREIIENCKSGFLIDQYNEDQMTEKICLLIKDKELRINFASHARDNLYKFDRKMIIDKWIDLIDKL